MEKNREHSRTWADPLQLQGFFSEMLDPIAVLLPPALLSEVQHCLFA